MYTALVSQLEHKVVVVCGKKTTVSEVVAIALAKSGKPELDPKRCVCCLISVIVLHVPALTVSGVLRGVRFL